MKSYEKNLCSLALSDSRIVVMTAENRAAIRTLPEHIGSRFIDVGICEQTLIGAAAGLASRGRRPIVHALAAFLTMRGFEFIRTDIGVGNLPVTLVGGVPGVLSDGNGPTHQAIEDIALMRNVPGMSIVAPADEEELVASLGAILESNRPAYVRYYDGPSAYVHSTHYELGKAETFGDPDAEVVIATYGYMVNEAIKVQSYLSGGPNLCVLNLRSLAPIDHVAIFHHARRAKLLVVLEDHLHSGGLFSIVAEMLASEGVTASILPINLGKQWFKPGPLDRVLENAGLSASRVASTIRNCWEQIDGKQTSRNERISPNRTLQLNLG